MKKMVRSNTRSIKATDIDPRGTQFKLEEIIESYGVDIDDFAEAMMSYFSSDDVVDFLKYYCKVHLDIDGDELEDILED